ncbi:MAG: sulfite exporter TauE/SafE family protein [Acidobacteria bacterium]|nr:sulfite exporter TauE/SafE family protein [Acidobacteriota bacterium]MDW7984740.1 sulfite exporter TauE/SafE family protein [Acidobacteriota bacterium]
MVGWLTVFGLGLVLGFRHAFDSDHVAAILSLVSETRRLRRAALYGAFWGLGHTLTLFVVGTTLLLFKWEIPTPVVQAFELLVGVVLIGLGVHVLVRMYREKVHIHWHSHGDVTHIHFHSHRHSAAHDHVHRPLLVGVIHGLAGSGSLTLLVMASLPSVFQGIVFILIFGLGSILGMVLTGAAVGVPFILTRQLEQLHRVVHAVAGGLSIAIGLLMIVEISFFWTA